MVEEVEVVEVVADQGPQVADRLHHPVQAPAVRVALVVLLHLQAVQVLVARLHQAVLVHLRVRRLPVLVQVLAVVLLQIALQVVQILQVQARQRQVARQAQPRDRFKELLRSRLCDEFGHLS